MDIDGARRDWDEHSRLLESVRREELRRMTDAEALAAAEAVLGLVATLPPRDTISGLVEQQRIFSRARGRHGDVGTDPRGGAVTS